MNSMSSPSSKRPLRAKLFQDGRSQVVRLPKDFRFEGDEVLVRRQGDAVILEPIKEDAWPPEYWGASPRPTSISKSTA
jgi:virulence-associated protein VagC